jgi:hypothetical protein
MSDDLFEGAKQAKQEGMARAAEGADQEWMRLMYSLVLKVAREKLLFTGDDVFRLYYGMDERPETSDYRALGPVMALAVKNNICRKTDKVAVTRRRSRHEGLLSVWKSMVFGKPDYLSSPMPEAAPESPPTNAYYDAKGRLVHDRCGVDGCARPAPFSVGFFPRRGQLGMWYCLEHWKENSNLEMKV